METIHGKEIKTVQSSITMIVLIISFSMLFGTLFMGYMVYRVRSTVWPPMGMNELGILYPTFSTSVIGVSSVAYYFFEKFFQQNNLSLAKFFLLAALFFGFAFCGTQYLVWSDLALKGVTQSSGVFGSIIYGFTWIHIAHVLLGLTLLIWQFFKFRRLESKNHTALLRAKNVGMFWHFLGIVWFILYLILFIF